MSGIEIGLVVVFSLICVVLWMMWLITQDIKHQNKIIIDKIIPNINNNMGILIREIGLDGKLDIAADGTEYLNITNIVRITINERINLLMDHLNLEIKEGEPSKTTLVKKKATKKSK